MNSSSSASSRLTRAKALHKGALGLSALASVPLHGASLVVQGGAVRGDLSGIPDYEGFLPPADGEMQFAPLAGGVKLWGATGEANLNSFLTGQTNWSGQPIYFEGVSMGWWGTLDGTFVGDRWEYDEAAEEDIFIAGDHMTLAYEFSVQQSTGINFSYEFLLHVGQGGDPSQAYWTSNHATGIFRAEGGEGWGIELPDLNETSVSGVVRFEAFSWDMEPTLFSGSWKLSLVVRPQNLWEWDSSDSLAVVVPGNSIDMGVNVVPIPEPATFALIGGGAALLGAFLLRWRRVRR